MKKHLLLFLCALCSIGASAQYSGSGTGTSNDPYLIFNENQLYQMNNFLNQEGVYFKLMKNLDLTAWIAENNPSQGWQPVGIESEPFKGIFLGNNYTVSGVWIGRSSTDNVGFFGYTQGASISNFTIEGTNILGHQNVGTLVGNANATTISGCSVSMTIVQGQDVGGLVGVASSATFSDCSYSGQVNASEMESLTAGGILGWAKGGVVSLTNCMVNGRIDAGSYAGGIVGSSDGPTSISITNSQANCDILGWGESGGIIGKLTNTSATFTNCHHEGEITSNGGDYHGGIVGKVYGGCLESMTDCSHFGKITGKNYVGGLVGAVVAVNATAPKYYLSTSSTTNTKTYGPYTLCSTGTTTTKILNNCTAIGNIVGLQYVGGLVGKDEVSTSHTVGNVSRSNNSGSIGNKENGWCLWRDNTCVSGSFYYYYSVGDKRDIVQLALTNSYYSGNIQGTENVGGLVGYKEGGSLTKCYSYATMVQGETNVGGLIGQMQGSVEDQSSFNLTLKSNFAINTTVNATKSDLGRIYGLQGNSYVTIGALGSAEDNIALTRTKVILSGVVQEVTDCFQHGTSMGPSLLKLKANYVAQGWNFDNDWAMLETECFPYKCFQTAPPVIESNLISQATTISGKSVNGGTVYLYYKDNAPVTYETSGNQWTFATEPLQSGAGVQLCAHVNGMTPSYFTITSVGYPGSGTKEDPYRVYTAEDLQGVSGTGYYKMMNDIDLTAWIAENSPTIGWVSIGRNSGEATYFDGDGHTVSGLWINTTDDYTGLFSNFSTGEIINLTVQIKEGLKVKGGDYTGGLIGRNANGKIENVTVKGEVEGTGHVGGVAGIITNNILHNITYEGTVRATADNAYIGGIAGQSTSGSDQFFGCEATAILFASGTDSYVGGIVGNAYGTLDVCHAQATITAGGARNQVGGLVGQSSGGMTRCYSTGAVTASGEESNTGGLVGRAHAWINNCYSTANATGTLYTAGLVAYTTSSIDKCYAKGDVYGVEKGAGLVGQLDGVNAKVTNCVAVNNILSLSSQSSWGSRVIGGFKNGAPDPDESNYALNTMQVSLNNVPQIKTDDFVEGFAKTQEELQTTATYTTRNWDFQWTWGIDEGSTYPHLQWANTGEESHTHNFTNGICECGFADPAWKTVDGNGYYRISNAQDLRWFSSMVSVNGESNINASLTSDINLEGNEWQPIGTPEHPFIGSFDGQGHRIRNMVINNAEANSLGLFGAVAGETSIKNVIIDNSCSVYGSYYCAGVVGSVSGQSQLTIENCGNEANIHCCCEESSNAAGILGCCVNGEAIVLIKNCYNTGNISGIEENAGLCAWIGANENSQVINSWSAGSVEGFEEGKPFVRFGCDGIGFINNCYSISGLGQNGVSSFISEQMASGELCFLLNNSSTRYPAWRQTIGVDAHPVLDASHGVVFKKGDTYANNRSDREPLTSSPWTGVELPDDGGTYYLYNVESGLWFQHNRKEHDLWTTHAQLDLHGSDVVMTPIVDNEAEIEGLYQLNPRFKHNHSLNAAHDMGYMDTDEPVSQWCITQQTSLPNFTATNMYEIFALDGAVLLGANLGDSNDDTYISFAALGYNHWQFVSREERMADLETATTSNPKDATWLIDDWDFAWNNERFSSWNNEFKDGNNVFGGDRDEDCRYNRSFESWISTLGGVFYQDITGLPNGAYHLTLQGFYRDGPNGEIGSKHNNGEEVIRAFYFGNEVSAPLLSICENGVKEAIENMFPVESEGFYLPGDGASALPNASLGFANGYYWNPGIEVIVTDGKLRIGVKKDAGVFDDWIVFDNFKLTYLGAYDGQSVAALRSLVANAQTLYDNSVEGTNVGEYEVGARQQLLTVINAVNAQISDTMDAATITSCTAAINAAIETFQSKKVTSILDTDISGFDNILYAPALEVTPGQQAMLSICLKNAVELSSFEFRLYLPEGVSIAWSEEDNDYAINLNSSRASLKRFTTSFAEQTDGSMQIICYSSQNHSFVGNDGEVINILLDIADEMADGDYAIYINHQEMATASMTTFNVAQCKSTLTVLSYLLGDVNGDQQVSVVDINGVVNLILGTNTNGLLVKAADTNCDGSISVVDINGVVNIILYGNPMGPSPAPALRGKWATEPAAIRMDDISLCNGWTTLVGLTVEGVAGTYSSMQFDVLLPEGITMDVKSDNHHLVCTALQDDGTTRVVCTSLSNHPFTGNTPLTISLTADEAAEGDYALTLTHIELASPHLTTTHPADYTAALRVHGTTGINMLNASDGQPLYNLQGIRMEGGSNMEKGVFIQNDKKFFKK